MFRLFKPSSVQIQNIVLVHSVSADLRVLVHSVSAHLRVHSQNVPVLCFVFGLTMA